MTDEARAGEPRTKAGRSFKGACGYDHTERILAIEREAAAAPALDVERLAEALSGVSWRPGGYVRAEMYWPEKAKAVIAEYARLSESAP